MTGGDNLIIILMWDVMNNSVDRQHTSSYRDTHSQSITINNSSTAKGQCISIHYMEQHISMCAFISATEVNALQESYVDRPPLRFWITSGFVQRDPGVTQNHCEANPHV